jgi:hypothetical protein
VETAYYISLLFVAGGNDEMEVSMKKFLKLLFLITLLIVLCSACSANGTEIETQNNASSRETTKITGNELYFGGWLVKREIKVQENSIYGKEEIRNLLGKKITFLVDTIKFEKEIFKNAIYKKYIKSKSEFMEYKIPLEDLGIKEEYATGIDVQIPKGKSKLRDYLCSSILIKNRNSLILISHGVFFELVRNITPYIITNKVIVNSKTPVLLQKWTNNEGDEYQEFGYLISENDISYMNNAIGNPLILDTGEKGTVKSSTIGNILIKGIVTREKSLGINSFDMQKGYIESDALSKAYDYSWDKTSVTINERGPGIFQLWGYKMYHSRLYKGYTVKKEKGSSEFILYKDNYKVKIETPKPGNACNISSEKIGDI